MTFILIVTGGGRGIGAETSLKAAEAGWDVCISYRSNASRAREIAGKVEAAGRRALIVQADIGSEADIRSFVRNLRGRAWDAVRTGQFRRHSGTVEPHRQHRRHGADRTHVDQCRRQYSVRARSGEAHVDKARRRGWCDRQSVVASVGAGWCRRVCPLWGKQGRDKYVYSRAGAGSRRRRRSCVCRQSGRNRHRDPAGRSRRGDCTDFADEAGRTAGRGCQCRCMVVIE